jgi:hypothetical protein
MCQSKEMPWNLTVTEDVSESTCNIKNYDCVNFGSTWAMQEAWQWTLEYYFLENIRDLEAYSKLINVDKHKCNY